MSSGKKGKKKKCKTVDLMSFLADGSGTPLAVPVKPTSWADDVEEDHADVGYTSRSSKEPVILPTAPRAARGPRVADEDIPTSPPYVAYISNLPFEVNEDDLAVFFSGLKIANMRLPKDSSKLLRGYGYVEFEDRQSLIGALCISNMPMKTRRIRIEVSNSSNDDRRGGRMGRDSRRDGYDDPERTTGDWRSGPRTESSTAGEGDSYRSRYENRDRRDDREPSEMENKPGAWRESTDRGRSAFRDRGGFKDEERDWGGRFNDKGSRDRDGDRGSSFGPRRTFDRDSDRERGDRERDWGRVRSSAEPKPAEPARTRPKLQLQPRTKPVEPIAPKEEQPPAAAAAAAAPAAPAAPKPAAANIFGAARPVDTTAREREIEERLAKTYAESKAKEEGDGEKRGARDGTWGKRNGEGRDEKEKSRLTWRSEDRRSEKPTSQSQTAHPEEQEGSRGPPPTRSAPAPPKAPPKPVESRATTDRDRKEKDKDDVNRMPKAKDEQAPNFVASNKYSMLPDDVEPDNIDD